MGKFINIFGHEAFIEPCGHCHGEVDCVSVDSIGIIEYLVTLRCKKCGSTWSAQLDPNFVGNVNKKGGGIA